jgi:hypothetical protein
MAEDSEERETPDDPDAEDLDDLDAREEARVRRRDREIAAERDELMRPGMGKVFKQITDSWGEKAAPDQSRAEKKAAKGSNRPR